ncbi:MAG TPA: phosphate ABC transporter substrate-binding protein PstS [Bryobacteraceae bacterium]|nr:phosphate ABC transporter substrate-binding protein PstS [Bryobacteraceae bacterium]
MKTESRSRLSRALGVAFLAAALCGCSGGRADVTAEAPAGGVSLRGAGATFPSLLYKKWFGEYRAAHPDVAVSYDPVGSGEGIRRFIGKGVKEEAKVDFGASDAAMTDEQMAQVSKGALLVPATAGSVVLAYNLPQFQGELKLSRAACAGIFLGQIKSWNDPAIASTNPGANLPRLTIVTVARQDASGTTFAFTKHLDAISPEWRARYGAATLIDWPGNTMRARGNENVAGRIQHAEGSIGYVGYEFAHRLGLPMASLENREGNFVRPGDRAGMAALATADLPPNLRLFIADPAGRDAYPIVTFSWILLYQNNDDPRKAKAIRDLFRWCLTDGQRFASELGYVPLSPNVSSKALLALNQVGPPE